MNICYLIRCSGYLGKVLSESERRYVLIGNLSLGWVFCYTHHAAKHWSTNNIFVMLGIGDSNKRVSEEVISVDITRTASPDVISTRIGVLTIFNYLGIAIPRKLPNLKIIEHLIINKK